MSQSALEQGSWHYPSSSEGHWAEFVNSGFVEVDGRVNDDVDLRVFYREAGNLVLLCGLSDSGESASTLVEPEETMDSLHHPSKYFSHEASDRLFGQAA